jgi:drug/metabolite transporter (DMT)-like permease
MTRAYAATDVTIALPFDYARLPFAAVIGFIAFAETPDVWTWLGAFVIAGATVYIAHRESRLANGQAGERIGTATLGTGGAAIIPPGPPETKP